LREELAHFKRACERLEELLARTRSEVSEVMECLHEMKERVSNVEALLLVHLVKAGLATPKPLIELLSAVSLASLVVELNLARLALQGASALKKIKTGGFEALWARHQGVGECEATKALGRSAPSTPEGRLEATP